MRSNGNHLDVYRMQHPLYPATRPGELRGFFVVPRPHGERMFIISSGNRFEPADEAAGLDRWEHVSVSFADRCPTWDEMCVVKDLFWGPNELVLQYHVPKADHINVHPYTLHLWRYRAGSVPVPPPIAVGPSRADRRAAFARRVRSGLSGGGGE